MTLLLDTQAFLWWITDSPKLSDPARAALKDEGNEILFSAASAWEIATKVSIGKLPLPASPSEYVPLQMQLNGIQPLSITPAHALHLHSLPWHHRDPFDRMLVAQAQLEAIPIITVDPMIHRYDVQIVW